MKKTILKLSAISAMCGLAFVPTSTFAAKLYCYVNGEYTGEPHKEKINPKLVEFTESGVKKQGYLVSKKEADYLLKRCEESDSKFNILEGVSIEARLDNTYLGSIFGKQYGYPIVTLDGSKSKPEYIRSAFKASDGTNKEILSVDKYLKENKTEINNRSTMSILNKAVFGVKNYAQGFVNPLSGQTVGGLNGTDPNNTSNYITNLVKEHQNNGVVDLGDEVIVYSDNEQALATYYGEDKIVNDITKFSHMYATKQNIKLLYTGSVTASNGVGHAVLLIVDIDRKAKKIDLKIVDSLMSQAANKSDSELLNRISHELTTNITSIAYIKETVEEEDFTLLESEYHVETSIENLNIQAPLQTDCGRYVAIWIDAIINGIDYKKLDSNDYSNLLKTLNSGKKYSLQQKHSEEDIGDLENQIIELDDNELWD
ncbi:hypothetical protein BZ13_1230 [Francisella philomiragia subsp. philomiragia ATCC 25015]|uniref:hypothetical protein n=1 Tax=Francisella philomiragia TaxID=28110 RepID=UPI0001AF7A5D|nr:hypothetical protein [Francisella philomiragia]AJI75150.1 hypothetical protein BZ13_1230 [Francisella philomiragia subsp. philomiragia ATCC 25015]EET20575.1 predicted protein [Francisella philomiragia subsp. philomiragia ATCC 25015]MBK2237617.1 hypothetical protein [Francisella philomiragia]